MNIALLHLLSNLKHLLSNLRRLRWDGNVAGSRSEHRRVATPARQGWVPAPRASRRAGYLRAVRSDAGMSTAEYAVGTVAAVAFAVVLFKVVQSPAVHQALSGIVTGALNVHL